MARPEKLTDKQDRFVDEYLTDFNATQAAIRAGYSENGAAVQGHHLLRNPKVADQIAARGAQTADQLGMTREYVFRTLREGIDKALAGAPKVLGTKDGPVVVRDDNGDTIYEWSPAGVKGLVELLARIRGDLVDKVEHSGGVTVSINGVDVSKLS